MFLKLAVCSLHIKKSHVKRVDSLEVIKMGKDRRVVDRENQGKFTVELFWLLYFGFHCVFVSKDQWVGR